MARSFLGRADRAGRDGLADASGEGLRVGGRSSTQQRIVRSGNAVRQHQRIEVDRARSACALAFDVIDSQDPDVDLFAASWPSQGGITGGVSWLCDCQHQTPAQGLLSYASDQRVEQEICG